MNYSKLALILLLLLALTPIVYASLDSDISDEDKEKFDEILTPVMKVYNFIKYIASAVAAIFLLFAGISYMTSGSDPRKRDQAKNMAAYVVIGLFIIWATPLVVEFLVG